MAYLQNSEWQYFDVVISSVLGKDNVNRNTADHQAGLKIAKLKNFLSPRAMRDVKFYPVAISTGGAMNHTTAEVLRRLLGAEGVHGIVTAAMIGNAMSIRDVVAAAVDAPAEVVRRWLRGKLGDAGDADDAVPSDDDVHVVSGSDEVGDDEGGVGENSAC